MALIPLTIINSLTAYIRGNRKNNTTALILFKPSKEINNFKEVFNEKDNIKLKIMRKMEGDNIIDYDMCFLDACQASCIYMKLLGYLGVAQHIFDQKMKLMVINTLKKDLIDQFNGFKNINNEKFMNSQIKLEKLPIYTILALRFLINSDDIPIEEIKSDIQFVCDPLYLLLFYKLYKKEIDDSKILFEESEEDETIKENNQAEGLVIYNEKSKNKANKDQISIDEMTLADIMKTYGLWYPSFLKEKNNEQHENFDLKTYTRNFFSLKLKSTDILNHTLLIKLEFLTDQDRIKMSQSEIAFLLQHFIETTCFITKTKIIEVITKINKISRNENWNKIILSKLKYPGIYTLPYDRLALLFACLKYLISHKIAVSDVNLFLYRLLHAVNPNIVSATMKLLRLRKISNKQVIDRCLKMDRMDDISLNTLLFYITSSTARFTFEKLKNMNLIFSSSLKIQIIIQKILEVAKIKLLVRIIGKYPNLATSYDIIHYIRDKKILISLRNKFLTNLNIYTIQIICRIIENGLGYEIGNNLNEMEITCKYLKFLNESLKIIAESSTKKKRPILCYLLSIGMKYGDITKNKKIFEEFARNIEYDDVRSIIEENLIFFKLFE